jgi:hypothetical protein
MRQKRAGVSSVGVAWGSHQASFVTLKPRASRTRSMIWAYVFAAAAYSLHASTLIL